MQLLYINANRAEHFVATRRGYVRMYVCNVLLTCTPAIARLRLDQGKCTPALLFPQPG